MMENAIVTESFLEHLIDGGVIDEGAAVHVLDEQRLRTPPIGRIALVQRYLTMKQVFEILNVQTDTKLRFGEQAIALGYLDEKQLTGLLDEQVNSKPGVGVLLYDLGYANKGTINKSRREFMRGLESILT